MIKMKKISEKKINVSGHQGRIQKYIKDIKFFLYNYLNIKF